MGRKKSKKSSSCIDDGDNLIPALPSDWELLRRLIPPTLLDLTSLFSSVSPPGDYDRHMLEFDIDLTPDELDLLDDSPLYDVAIQVSQLFSSVGKNTKIVVPWNSKAVLLGGGDGGAESAVVNLEIQPDHPNLIKELVDLRAGKLMLVCSSEWKQFSKFVGALSFVRLFPPTDTLKYTILGRGRIPKEVTKERIQKLIKRSFHLTGENFMDVCVTCQLTTKRILHPAKYSTCSHAQCFELYAFLEMVHTSLRNSNTKFSFDSCPICRKDVKYKHLLVDDFFTSILHAPDKHGSKGADASTVRIYENGEWEWISNSKGGSSLEVQMIDDDDDDESNHSDSDSVKEIEISQVLPVPVPLSDIIVESASAIDDEDDDVIIIEDSDNDDNESSVKELTELPPVNMNNPTNKKKSKGLPILPTPNQRITGVMYTDAFPQVPKTIESASKIPLEESYVMRRKRALAKLAVVSKAISASTSAQEKVTVTARRSTASLNVGRLAVRAATTTRTSSWVDTDITTTLSYPEAEIATGKADARIDANSPNSADKALTSTAAELSKKEGKKAKWTLAEKAAKAARDQAINATIAKAAARDLRIQESKNQRIMKRREAVTLTQAAYHEKYPDLPVYVPKMSKPKSIPAPASTSSSSAPSGMQPTNRTNNKPPPSFPAQRLPTTRDFYPTQPQQPQFHPQMYPPNNGNWYEGNQRGRPIFPPPSYYPASQNNIWEDGLDPMNMYQQQYPNPNQQWGHQGWANNGNGYGLWNQHQHYYSNPTWGSANGHNVQQPPFNQFRNQNMPGPGQQPPLPQQPYPYQQIPPPPPYY